MNVARANRRAYARGVSRETLVLSVLALTFLCATFVIFFPRQTFVVRYFADVGPFSPAPRLTTLALPMLLLATLGVLALGIKWLPVLLKRPYLAASCVFLLGTGLNFALVATLHDGIAAFHRRALLGGHGEFLIEAASIQDLRQTIRHYEAYVRDRPERIFLAQKGPGVISFLYAIRLVASFPLIRPALEVVAPSVDTTQGLLSERKSDAAVPILGPDQMDNLRYLSAAVFFLYPFITYLPVFIIVWLGNAYVDIRFGMLAALLYVFVPAVSLRVASLDYSVYPTLVVAILALFAYGVDQNRRGLVAASAIVFTGYLTMTVAAVSLLAWLGPYVTLVTVQRVRNGKSLAASTSQMATVLVVFAIVCCTLLLAVYGLFEFDPLERYTYARRIQRHWVGKIGLWAIGWNLFGYFLSFSLIYTVCLFVQQWLSARRLLANTADSIDHIAISWLCLLVGLVAFGRQHGETDRLWAFLSPIGCLITARLLYDSIAWKRLWLPLPLFVLSLVLARYRLDYM